MTSVASLYKLDGWAFPASSRRYRHEVRCCCAFVLCGIATRWAVRTTPCPCFFSAWDLTLIKSHVWRRRRRFSCLLPVDSFWSRGCGHHDYSQSCSSSHEHVWLDDAGNLEAKNGGELCEEMFACAVMWRNSFHRWNPAEKRGLMLTRRLPFEQPWRSAVSDGTHWPQFGLRLTFLKQILWLTSGTWRHWPRRNDSQISNSTLLVS